MVRSRQTVHVAGDGGYPGPERLARNSPGPSEVGGSYTDWKHRETVKIQDLGLLWKRYLMYRSIYDAESNDAKKRL